MTDSAAYIASKLDIHQRNTLRFLYDPMDMPEGSRSRVLSAAVGGAGNRSLPFLTVMRGGFPGSMNDHQIKVHYMSLVDLGLIRDRWTTRFNQPAWPSKQTTELGDAVIEIIGR